MTNLSPLPVHNCRENPVPTPSNVVSTPAGEVVRISGPQQAALIILAYIFGFVSWPLFWIAMLEPIL